jgi:outer membrane protein assembly factor BamB
MPSKRLSLSVLLVLFSTSLVQALPGPVVEWEYRASSNLYAAPLVADIADTPGLETLLSDAEARVLRCLDSEGNLLWTYEGGWSKRLTSGASLSQGRILIGNPDGNLHCILASSGERLWSKQVGPITWGNAIWADLDGDGRKEAVAGTQDRGIHCFNVEGEELWVYPQAESEAPVPTLSSTLAAADVDGEGGEEVLFCTLGGPACLDGNGTLLWHSNTGGYFLGTVVIAGNPKTPTEARLYCCSSDPAGLMCFDACSGERLWQVPLFSEGEIQGSPGLAVGTLDTDPEEEILVGTQSGDVHSFDSGGRLLWVYRTGSPTTPALTLGDVDGDGIVEVLAASGDRHLHCLDSHGRLEWKYPTGRRLLAPATLADVDLDGRVEILFGGMDRTLRVLTLNGCYDPALLPWPSARGDEAQSGFYQRAPRTGRVVNTQRSLLTSGSFELLSEMNASQDFPANKTVDSQNIFPAEGWRFEGVAPARVHLATDTPLQGNRYLRITAPATFSTDLVELPAHLESVEACVSVRSRGDVRAWLSWYGRGGVLDATRPLTDRSAFGCEASEIWRDYGVLNPQNPPAGAEWVRLTCQTLQASEDIPLDMDNAQITANLRQPPLLSVFVNQVGYDTGAPKKFTAQSNFVTTPATFEILDRETREVVFAGSLEVAGRIQGAFGNDWGHDYWRGDFSQFNTPGHYRIRIGIGGKEALSWPFSIGQDLIWETTSRLAYEFFHYQRCGMEVPGFHAACHLDDGVKLPGGEWIDLSGGWHDAGDYNKYHNAPYVYGLARAYEKARGLFDLQDENRDGLADFLEEIRWGGDFSRRMIAEDGSARGINTSGYGFWGAPEQETDNLPDTGDERPFQGGASGVDSSQQTAACAKLARYLGKEEAGPFLEAAQRGFEWAMARGQKGALQLSAAMDLFVATNKILYASHAREIFPAVGLGDVHLVEEFDRLFGTDHTREVREMLVAEAESRLGLSQNPFGVFTHGTSERANFFNTPSEKNIWHLGTSDHLMTAAERMALAYRYQPDPRYLEFVYDQINWLLGNNPFDTSLMEGAGSQFLPSYHHRYIFSGVERGAVPGGLVNGITWKAPGMDVPELDLSGVDIPAFQSNEVWLPHNTNYLNLLSELLRARELP